MRNYYSGLLKGYSYKGQPAAVEVEVRDNPGFSFQNAVIYHYDQSGEIKGVADYEFRSLHGAFQWLSRNLDNKPKIFGDFSLAAKEIQRAINGEGAEHFVMSTLMLEYGLLVSQADRSMPDYDLSVENPDTKRTCKIQVKFVSSPRWPNVHKVDFDFLVIVTPILPLKALGWGEETSAHRERKLTAYVIRAEALRAKSGAGPRQPLRNSPYEWAWHLVLDYVARC